MGSLTLVSRPQMISMSDLKHDAIVKSGIPIHKRYEIPEDCESRYLAPARLIRR